MAGTGEQSLPISAPCKPSPQPPVSAGTDRSGLMPGRAVRAKVRTAKEPAVAYVLPDRQREALAEIREAEAEAARAYARRMRARYVMSVLWEDAATSGNDVFLELSGTARIGQTRAATELSDAGRLVEVFRETLAGLEAGVIWQPAAELLLKATRRCTEQIAAEVERRVLARLKVGNTTELRPLLQETVLQAEADLDPEALDRREQQAKDDRAVWINLIDDGMCQVGATMQDLDGQRWSLDFEELVRAQTAADKAAGRVRTRNQRRADVFAALPSQLLALLQAIAAGQTAELLAMAKRDPLAAEDLEHLAEQVRDLLPSDTDTDNEPSDPEPTSEAKLDERAGSDAASSDEQPTSRELVPADATDLTQDPFGLAVALMRLTVRDPKVLNVHVPMATLIDVDNRCGWVEGLGPISPHRTRLLIPSSGLRRIVVDARSGIPLHLDPEISDPDPPDWTNPHDVQRAADQVRQRLLDLLQPVVLTHSVSNAHDPTKSLAELLALRDRLCTGIGCSMAACRCHNDHETPWPDGPTAEWNLSNKSPRCHQAKHHGWDVTRDDTTGESVWQSPLGHTYLRPGVWQAPPDIPADAVLPPPRLLQEQPGPFYDDSNWNTPLSLPPRPAAAGNADAPDPQDPNNTCPPPHPDEPPF